MYKGPPWRGLLVHTSIIRVHTSIPTCAHMLARDRPRKALTMCVFLLILPEFQNIAKKLGKNVVVFLR
jgi:hypothetical protein